MKTIGARTFSFISLVLCTTYIISSLLINSGTDKSIVYEEHFSVQSDISDFAPVTLKKHGTETKRVSVSVDKNSSTQTLDHNSYFMVILIPSMPESFIYRHNLRTRWLNMSNWNELEFKDIDKQYQTFKLMFVVGKVENEEYSEEFLQEVSETDDIHLMDIVESRGALRHKLLWGMKKSVDLYKYTYFVKVDHDTLIDLPHLMRGLSVSQRDNLYTGYCNKRLRSSVYKGTFKYCLGGGYILSRDLVEKISLLEEKDTADVAIASEDGYTGYLAWTVAKQYNLTETIPRADVRVLRIFSKVAHGIQFNRYFYHWLKNFHNFDRVFECRIVANKTTCPSMSYQYPEQQEHCICDD